jgi:DNA-directed RNA polymerase specialized sigma24 family protein
METDEELYDRVRRGDLPAFDVLYERYAARKERGARAHANLPVEDPPPRVDAVLEESELRQALDGAVARLPRTLSEVYHLRTSGMSYEEMASVLELPLGTVKSRMNQLTVQLKEELRPWTAR